MSNEDSTKSLSKSFDTNPRQLQVQSQGGKGYFDYSNVTFRFKESQVQAEFNDHMTTRKIHRGVLLLLFLYNVIGSPLNTKSLYGKYGLYGTLFTYSCRSVHTLFFTIFALEMFGSRWLNGASESHKKWYYAVRSVLLTAYIINGPATAGFAMNIRSRNPCAPEQVSVMEVFYCSTSPRGMIPVDTFVIGQMLAVFQHFVFPIGWATVMMAWFGELILALISVIPTATPQTLVTNTIFIFFYVSTVALHHAVQTNVLTEYIRTQRDNESHVSGEDGASEQRLSNIDESKVIEDYLAKLYHRQTIGSATLPSHDQDTSSVDSSVSMSEHSMGKSQAQSQSQLSFGISTISAHSKLRQRTVLPKQPKSKFLTTEKSLSVDTSFVAGPPNGY